MNPVFRLFFVFIFIANFSLLNAQIWLGLKGGANIAHQNIQDVDLDFDSDEITGYTWGAFLDIPLGEGTFGIQPEFLLMQKGGKVALSDITTTTIDYIDVPILLKLKLINSGLFNIHLLGGPSFGYATSGEREEGNASVSINFGNENIRRFDIGIHAGGGVGIQLGGIQIFGDIRYLFGVSDLDENDNRSIKNNGLLLSGGLMFRLFGR